MDRSIYLIGCVWVVYIGILLPLYIIKYSRHGTVKEVGYKLILSAIFCLVGLFGTIRNHASVFSILVFLAMVFSMIGDYYLAFIRDDENKFIKGIISFGAAQMLYIIALSVIEGIHILEFMVTAIIVIPIWIYKNIKKPAMGKAEIPLTVYFTLVTLMAAKAVLMLLKENAPLTQQELFSFGALSFYISDLFLGTSSFIKSKKIFSYCVTVFYFTGQLMIASAVFYQ